MNTPKPAVVHSTTTNRPTASTLHFVTAGKKRAAKQPFSRLSDGRRFPVIVTFKMKEF
jgi:hypothetical protein